MDLGEKIYSWIYEHHKHLGISRGRGGDAIENEEQVTLLAESGFLINSCMLVN